MFAMKGDCMDHLKHWLDGIAAGAALSSLAGWLPPTLAVVASLMAIIWHAMQMYDRHQRRKAEQNG